MSTFTNYIQVTNCDNELYLIAFGPGGPSTELLHYTSGYSQPVDVTIYPGAVLPSGTYTLVAVGINWGSAANFTIDVYTTQGGSTPVATLSPPDGSVTSWTATTTLSVTANQ